MEMVLSNGFCEMKSEEMLKTTGGDIDWGAAADLATNFLVNKFIWTVAQKTYNEFYIPVVPKGSDPEPLYA